MGDAGEGSPGSQHLRSYSCAGSRCFKRVCSRNWRPGHALGRCCFSLGARLITGEEDYKVLPGQRLQVACGLSGLSASLWNEVGSSHSLSSWCGPRVREFLSAGEPHLSLPVLSSSYLSCRNG